MTHEVAKILAGTLEPLYRGGQVTVLCGLVKTVSQSRDNGIIRFPVPYDSDAPMFQIENSELIPDQKQRAIVYFEGSDSLITDYQVKKSVVSGGLRLVCWYNSNRFQQESTDPNTLHTSLIGNMLGLLKEHRLRPDGVLTALSVNATRVIDSYDTLFSKYSYIKERGQYLQNPYFAFGIDLDVKYQINHGCTTKPLLVNISDCC